MNVKFLIMRLNVSHKCYFIVHWGYNCNYLWISFSVNLILNVSKVMSATPRYSVYPYQQL